MTLGSAELTDSSQEQSRVPDPGLGMTRSASSPRLSSEAEAKVNAVSSVGKSVPHPLISLFTCVSGLAYSLGGELMLTSPSNNVIFNG